MIGNPLPELSILIICVNNQQFVPHKLVSLPYPRYQNMYNMQKLYTKCNGYKQQYLQMHVNLVLTATSIHIN